MRKIVFAAMIAAAAIVGGCTTFEDMDAGLNDFKGQHYNAAFAKLGFPDSEKNIAGYTVYVWGSQSSGSYTIPTTSTATSYVNGQTIYTQIQGTRTVDYDYNCKIEVIVDASGIIVASKFDGNIGGCERYGRILKPTKMQPK